MAGVVGSRENSGHLTIVGEVVTWGARGGGDNG